MRQPTAEEQRQAVERTDEVRRKRAAAPSWGDLASAFGEQGLVRNRRGKVTGYRYPQHDDPEKSRKVAQQAYEMWEPHRRVVKEQGGKRNAKVRTVRLLDRSTGRMRDVVEHQAERVARKNGLVESPRHLGMRVEHGLAGDMLWRNLAGNWLPTFRRCLGTPLSGKPEADRSVVHISPDGAHAARWNGEAWEEQASGCEAQ